MAIKKDKKSFFNKDCSVKGCEGRCHWIILKDNGNSIFEGAFSTKQEALDTVSLNNLSGYHIEHRFNQLK